jgi:hypothetical protein
MTPAQLNFQNKYDAFGNTVTPIAGNLSPVSNNGIVYNPANTPFAMGAMSLFQTNQNIVFLAQDGGSISIGTTNFPRSYDPTVFTSGVAGIVIYDKNGDAILQIGDGQIGGIINIQTNNPLYPTGLSLDGGKNRNTPFPLAIISDSSAQNDIALQISIGGQSDGLSIFADSTSDAFPLTVENDSTVASASSIKVNHYGSGNTAPPIQINNSNPISTDFKKYIGLGLNTIWVSDGTNPDTVLTGVKGDLCLNGLSGVPYYCSASGTTWIAL